jgi:hypothetical protein
MRFRLGLLPLSTSDRSIAPEGEISFSLGGAHLHEFAAAHPFRRKLAPRRSASRTSLSPTVASSRVSGEYAAIALIALNPPRNADVEQHDIRLADSARSATASDEEPWATTSISWQDVKTDTTPSRNKG